MKLFISSKSMTNRKMEDDRTGNTKKTCHTFQAAIATAITLSKTVKPMTLALFRRVGKGGGWGSCTVHGN